MELKLNTYDLSVGGYNSGMVRTCEWQLGYGLLLLLSYSLERLFFHQLML